MPAPKSKAIVSSSDSDSESSVGSDGEVVKKGGPKKRTARAAPGRKPRRKASSSSESASGSSSGSESDDVAPPPPKRRAPAPRGRKPKDREEGEVSGEESDDSSDDEWKKEFEDGYDDDMMGDEEDRANLAAMTDKDRESEIFKRIERRDALKARFEIEKKLRMSRQKEQKNQRRGSVEDAKMRSKDRKFKLEEKAQDSKGSAFSALKAQREEKARREKETQKQRELEQRQKEEARRLEADKKGKSDLYTTEDSGDESDTSRKSRSRSRSSSSRSSRSRSRSSSSGSGRSSVDLEQKRREAQIASKDQLSFMKLSRYKCEKWCHLPFFKKLATGCFVRVGIGMNKGESVYRVGEVVDVLETAKTYKLGKTSTNLGLKLRHGNSSQRVFRLEYISDQPFSDSEFEKWRETTMRAGMILPTVAEAEEKRKELLEAMDYRMKDSDIEHIITQKEKFRKSPFNYAMRKTRLMKEKEIAHLSGDVEKVAQLQEELNELEEKAESLDSRRTASIHSIAYINERNRKRNVQESERAILEELKTQAGQKGDDPFTRRSTKPSMIMTAKSKSTPQTTVVEPQPVDVVDTATPVVSSKAEPVRETPVVKENPVKGVDTSASGATPAKVSLLRDDLLDDFAWSKSTF